MSLPWYRRLGADFAQIILKNKAIGAFFFQQIAKPQTVRKILLQAYRRSEAVTEELVEIILKPARDPGAFKVFLAFTAYSGGPLPEDLLPILPCRAILLWGSEEWWLIEESLYSSPLPSDELLRRILFGKDGDPKLFLSTKSPMTGDLPNFST